MPADAMPKPPATKWVDKPEPAREPFHIALRDLREERGVTLRRLAELTGYSHSNIGALEQTLGENHGKRRAPTEENITRIAEALQVPPTHFLEYRELAAERAAREAMHELGLSAVLEALAAARSQGT